MSQLSSSSAPKSSSRPAPKRPDNAALFQAELANALKKNRNNSNGNDSGKPLPQQPNLASCLAALNLKPSPDVRKPSQGVRSLARVDPQDGPRESGAQDDMEQRRVQRREAAVQWVDKEIRKLIFHIQRLGSPNSQGQYQVTFGCMFEETSNIFEALSGTLNTARKQKVVSYDGELLMQHCHDDTMITLLRTSISDSATTTYIKDRQSDDVPREKQKGRSFERIELPEGEFPKCFLCLQTVYPAEYVGIDDRTFHNTCFRCSDCSTLLSPATYACHDDTLYCKTHYQQRYKIGGNYTLGF